MAHDGFLRISHADAATLDLRLASALRASPGQARADVLGVAYAALTQEGAARAIEARVLASGAFAYAACVRAQDAVALDREPALRAPLYADAWLTLNASCAIAAAARIGGVTLARIDAAALAATLLRAGVDRDERICIIGGDAGEIAAIAARFKLNNVHWRPLASFGGRRSARIEAAALHIARTRARLTLIDAADGEGERIARTAMQRGDAIGVGLCAAGVLRALAGAPAPQARLGALTSGVRQSLALTPAWFYWLCARWADWTASSSARMARWAASSSR
jgi:UDP-N-acetyl-D-mannosaminuronic acid transferase (WecB/TagA/CpsF family)